VEQSSAAQEEAIRGGAVSVLAPGWASMPHSPPSRADRCVCLGSLGVTSARRRPMRCKVAPNLIDRIRITLLYECNASAAREHCTDCARTCLRPGPRRARLGQHAPAPWRKVPGPSKWHPERTVENKRTCERKSKRCIAQGASGHPASDGGKQVRRARRGHSATIFCSQASASAAPKPHTDSFDAACT
jgi:hypothetical protein